MGESSVVLLLVGGGVVVVVNVNVEKDLGDDGSRSRMSFRDCFSGDTFFDAFEATAALCLETNGGLPSELFIDFPGETMDLNHEVGDANDDEGGGDFGLSIVCWRARFCPPIFGLLFFGVGSTFSSFSSADV